MTKRKKSERQIMIEREREVIEKETIIEVGEKEKKIITEVWEER